ncbi:hypothetical protein BBO99_00001050 [Phytophthora kernoviae]|uniref:J domain-containing protein n=1 Tax=Phytophthora kernoviae TaxID=325452 RepID=A0A3R7JBL0_9STRA|nr:hypothetical protein BBI17_001021 [Phytophthora kernoviae]RLN84737.1 hypothetical protein BBO99_00001050 [Phytophthora kernoviae]
MTAPTTVSRPAKTHSERSGNASRKKHAWWWPGASSSSEQEAAVASSETELLNAAVLCAALSATQLEPSSSDKQTNERAVKELEMHVRKSPLPHSLQLPVLAFTCDYVLVQSDLAVLCANTFQRFRDFNIMKEIDYQYSPCGTYFFLSKAGTDHQLYSEPDIISEMLHREDDSAASLTGNAILQHLMSAYVDAIARRSQSIQINETMNFYERLGVPRNATDRQIRSAYKALALKWHPDRWSNNPANSQEQASAEEIFKLLAESYEVLSDVEARKKYDVHLNDSPSIKDEFVRNGTVNGMTLDEAIATFRDVIDNLSGAVSKVTSRFSTSSSTVVRHPLRGPPSVRSGLIPNNHDNVFMPDRIRVSRTVGIGTDQREQILYLEPEEIVAGDVAAPNQAASSSGANAGLRTVSMLADRVVARYRLDTGEAGGTLRSLAAASGDGALDSGIRAAGGLALANGVLSTTTEQLMMQDFRLKTGEVIASRTAAAAGAGIGAYSVVSALGMWSTAGLAAGPVGVVAATSAAVVGGMLGFFAGSKVYSASTAGYFTSQQNAKENIDRLELGARLLFDEFDPDATGEISKDDCIRLMKKLYDALGSISESGYERTMTVIQDEAFEGPVTWGMFWEWVSSEAARALRELEKEESKKFSEPVPGETWWASYMKYFSYLNTRTATPLLAEPQAAMYPTVLAALRLSIAKNSATSSEEAKGSLVPTESEESKEEESLVLKAQIEFLVNNGHLTIGDAFQIREQLASSDPLLKDSARKTILAMHEGLSDAGPEQNIVSEGFGFTGGDNIDTSGADHEKEEKNGPTKDNTSRTALEERKAKENKPDERLDVMCSLMSTQGLQRFLQRQNIFIPGEDETPARHEDLHCLALMATAPTITSASAPSN